MTLPEKRGGVTMFPYTMTLTLLRAWVYGATLEQLEEARSEMSGKKRALILRELKRREANA